MADQTKDPDQRLARPQDHDPGRPLGQFDMLDTYEAGVAPEEPRIEAIATISAGFKNDKGLPQRSRDGTIYLHDPDNRAPGLKAALEATDHKTLTITFPFDDPRLFIQQRFVQYSKTRLLAYGDQHGVTVIAEDGTRTEYDREANPTEYQQAVGQCKTSVSVYFALVEWQGDQPAIVMPDGMGFYRIRFTGRNSLRSFLGHMRLLTRFTQGRLAGIPFELRIVNREVADATGTRRTVPVFTPTMKVPGMQLTSHNFRGVLQDSIHQADALQLMPPQQETIDDAERDAEPVDLDAAPAEVPSRESGDAIRPDAIHAQAIQEPFATASPEPDEHDLARLQSALDYDTERARFFATVKGTPLDTEEDRAALLTRHFGPDPNGTTRHATLEGVDTSSLREVIPRLTPEQWDAFLAHAEQAGTDATARQKNAKPQAGYPSGVTKRHTEWLEGQIDRFVQHGLPYSDRLRFLSWITTGRPDELQGNADLTTDHFEALRDIFGRQADGKYQPLTDREVAEFVDAYTTWTTSDEAAAEVIG